MGYSLCANSNKCAICISRSDIDILHVCKNYVWMFVSVLPSIRVLCYVQDRRIDPSEPY